MRINPPNPYVLGSREALKASEMTEFEEVFGWDYCSVNQWEYWLGKALHISSVRDSSEKLVGVGFLENVLSTSPRHAELCNLAVLPNHRGKGIGTYIIGDRIQAAKNMGLTQVNVRLDSTNTLQDHYKLIGFILSDNIGCLALGDKS